MAAKAFLEQYMDCMDALPLDMQRHASQYLELDMKSQDLLSEALCVQSDSTRALAVGATAADKRKWLIQLQRWMLAIMEVGTEKVEVTSHMLDTVEGYSQQLSLAEKEMVSCRTRDELTGGSSSRSNSNATSFNPHAHKSVQHSLPALLEVVEKRKIERNQKRARTQEKGEESDVPAANPPKEARRDSSTSATSVPPPISTNTNPPPVKPIKSKKVKTSKKKNSIPRDQPQPHPLPTTPTPVSAAVPTPDFTTEPIDPDEPTYCLCNQVSFGEMIGCDNDDCPIEWFHFQCVGLTAKPKGKWYCPQCQRSKPRSGKS